MAAAQAAYQRSIHSKLFMASRSTCGLQLRVASKIYLPKHCRSAAHLASSRAFFASGPLISLPFGGVSGRGFFRVHKSAVKLRPAPIVGSASAYCVIDPRAGMTAIAFFADDGEQLEVSGCLRHCKRAMTLELVTWRSFLAGCDPLRNCTG